MNDPTSLLLTNFIGRFFFHTTTNMKSFLSLLFFILVLSASAFKQENNHKIDLKGKVLAVNSSKAIPSKISVRAEGVNITVETDKEGKFSTSFVAVSTFTISIQAPGFEKQEQILSVPLLKSD